MDIAAPGTISIAYDTNDLIWLKSYWCFSRLFKKTMADHNVDDNFHDKVDVSDNQV
jgi:hypothetical protein